MDEFRIMARCGTAGRGEVWRGEAGYDAAR